MARCAALVDSPTEIQLVIRLKNTRECLGVTALERPADASPELGIWMKEAAHGRGYGREAIEALVRWASVTIDSDGFLYPVAVENTPSRRIAERLGGEIIATRPGAKYDSVIYRIPARP
jgi:RimJ/RimL family protein N-acetyltransferase